MPDHSTFLICANDAASFACMTDVDTNCACADAGAHLESQYAETQVENHTVSELVTPELIKVVMLFLWVMVNLQLLKEMI